MNNIHSDKPILKSSEDLLKRKNFSDKIANYLLSPSSNDGLVISINGKWGSGKTSTANLIKEKIQNESFSFSSDIIPVIIDYSPWNATDQNQIINQFLNTLSEHFVYKRVLKILRTSLRIASGVLSFTPIPSNIKTAIKCIDNAFSKYVDALTSNSGSLEEIKNKVEIYLRNTKLRYIVFVDDLDRLNKSEIRLLIQLIKSTCNFSNITYVLLFNKEIVADALSNEQLIDGNAYLEKIIQLEFNIPLIRSDIIIDLLGHDLEQLLGDKTDNILNKRIQDYLGFGMFRQFTTIREEKRYINNLKFVLDMFEKEIDIPDLMVITYLRLIDERIYKLFLNNQDYLLGTHYFDKDGDANKAESEFINKIKRTKFDYDRSPYLINHIFPYMFSRIPEKYGDDYLSGRFFIPNIFHKYAQMDYDYEDFSLDRINSILRFDDSSQNLSEVSKGLNPDQGRKLLHVLSNYCENLDNQKAFESVLEFLFKDFSELQYSRPFLIVDKNYYVGSICSSLLRNLDNEIAEKILMVSVENGSDIGALVCLCNYFLYSKEDRHFNFSGVSDNCRNRIISNTLTKVLIVIDEDVNGEYYSFNSIITFAITQGEDLLRNTIKAKDDAWLSTFIVRSVYLSHSYSDDHHFYPIYQIDLIKKVLDIDDKRIDKLITNCDDNRSKQRLITFKMQLDGKVPEDKHIYGFSMKEIQDFCNKNNIVFIASDDYEK